jgi:protein SCO1/2
MKSARFFGIGLGVLLVLGAGWLGFQQLRPHTFTGMVMQASQPAADFKLTAHTGQPTRMSDLRGRYVLLYFGYAFCPDVCPATISEVVKARSILGEKAEQVQFVMVSVDPERDSLDKLGGYLAHFDPGFLGLTGSIEEVQQAATLYGVFFEKVEGTAATGYLINHTATLMLIDPDGYLREVFPFGTTGEQIAADLQEWMR